MHMHTMFGGDPKQIGGRIFTSTKFLYTVPTYPTIYGSRVKQAIQNQSGCVRPKGRVVCNVAKTL